MNYINEYKKIFEGGIFLRDNKQISLKEYYAFDGLSIKSILKYVLKELESRNSVTVLDWGCGSGKPWHELCLCNKTKSLMNILGPKVRGFYRYDPANTLYNIKPEGKFDFIICADVLEHIPDNELQDFFKEINSHLREGGVLFYSISTKPSRNFFADGTNMHLNIKSQKEWFEILKKNSNSKSTTRVIFDFNGPYEF